ncbi:ATP-binding cassette domain-containing protein [Gluconobacter kanchanaburiensis]|uniref:ABC transporter ATP-binding protein n=1 Tax=Gluconobacter kanchanaburiensis NBRC 103587 TaxID=1307948 RepID=A0A511B9C8_9PROT|nr:ATP-binding cassette domain-containing protein [Gluconobacter kanchanaburiensis]MBF0862591.1 ABC transporter ATP-binding protein [Gluconobacter kanchanaburiensis]GBR71964.1 peptide ABC transporter ATP-binding protein [Gluconobacter kanchanaburiensis NBRC 103587]GEK96914.1 ABC transporter ATP-binding protein [Gluconobacter kanchanaburiensis NBRC 103587]
MIPILQARDVTYHLAERQNRVFKRRFSKAILQNICLDLHGGRTLGIIGASGSGKSTLCRVLSGLVSPSGGQVLYQGQDLETAPADVRKKIRPSIQMIFQDPYGALDPRQTVRDIVGEPLADAPNRDAHIASALAEVGLSMDVAGRYPQAFSGGQRQRIAIARSLITRPSVIIADEAVSALDVSTQAVVLNLLLDLQQRHGLAYVFVSHDLAVIRHLSHDIAVLDAGHIVESGAAQDILHAPAHPVTQALIENSY